MTSTLGRVVALDLTVLMRSFDFEDAILYLLLRAKRMIGPLYIL